MNYPSVLLNQVFLNDSENNDSSCYKASLREYTWEKTALENL